jgi:hypothetical protein
MSFKTVEFICEENVAARGTPAAPRPADRPRPTAAELERLHRAPRTPECIAPEATPGQSATEHDVTA